MKIFLNVILVLLVLLAVSSGATKILLMQQDVDFFRPYGFTNPILIAFGITQVIGGIMLPLLKTRVAGGLIISITFLISAVLLLLSGNILMAVITLVFIVLIGFFIKQSLNARKYNSDH